MTSTVPSRCRGTRTIGSPEKPRKSERPPGLLTIAGTAIDILKDMSIQIKNRPALPYSLTLAIYRSLQSVVSKSGKGVYASGGVLFRGAVFGRDSLEVAEDIYVLRPRLVRSVLLTLGALQGTKFDTKSEEEPGKIPHEHRTRMIDGHTLSADELYIYEQLAKHWGEQNGTLTYYGSVDATPLFVRLTCRFVRLYGSSILKATVARNDGQEVSMRVVLQDALKWIEQSVASSQFGMLSYQRQNPHGLENQVWKDSAEFYRHSDGTVANIGAPIASIEVQGLVYDAYVEASGLLHRPELIEQAHALRDKVLATFWLPDVQYFALGIDQDPGTGKSRIIPTITANPAELLDTKIFDALPTNEKQQYIEGIVHMIFSQQFLTAAGIRSRSLQEQSIVSYWDYHGSNVTWPKETYDIARGLRRQNLPNLAKQLEYRLVNITRHTKEFYEFYFVDDQGRVLLHEVTDENRPYDFAIVANNPPMEAQAWTISALMALRYPSRIPSYRPMQPWQRKLEQRILAVAPKHRHLRSKKALTALYPAYTYHLTKKNSWIDER